MTQVDPEVQKQRIATIAKWGLAGVVCLIVSPVIFFAIKGLVGLVIAAGIGFVSLQLAPIFAMKISNWKMRLAMGEASKNPIETMINIYTDNMKTIGEKDKKISDFSARLGDFKSKMQFFAQKYPNEVAQYQEAEQKMEFVLARQKQKQKAAKVAANLYHDQIDKARAIYEMSCAAHSVTELAGDLEKQAFQDIMKQVSFDSVTHSFNLAVSELSVEADTDPESFIGLASPHSAPMLPESVGNVPMPQMAGLNAEAVPVKARKA